MPFEKNKQRLMKWGRKQLPDVSDEGIEKGVLRQMAKGHLAPDEHYEAARGGVFIHNHPNQDSTLSKADKSAQAKFGIKEMWVVAGYDVVIYDESHNEIDRLKRKMIRSEINRRFQSSH